MDGLFPIALKNTSASVGIFDPAITQVKEKIEGRVDGDKEMIDAHQY